MKEMNEFIKANLLGANDRTENGALSYSTFGNEILNQFGKAGSYRNRPIEDVWYDQQQLWAENSDIAMKFPFYLRMITRTHKMKDNKQTQTVQLGQGARDESFKRLLWIAKYHPKRFYDNLWLLPIIGSWKDLFQLMAFDGANEYLDYDKFYQIIVGGINDDYHKDLIKKYLPRIRSNSKCHTPWAIRTNNIAKDFCHKSGWSYKDYRTFKATGKAHTFQTIITKKDWENINWNAIPGKALLNLVNGSFLERHYLVDNYSEWLDTQSSVKFNGYPFELGVKLKNNRSRIQYLTVDKQFDYLIKTMTDSNNGIQGNVLCGLDTSASMEWESFNNNITPYDVCISLGIYFSELNKGAFHNQVALFASRSKLLSLEGSFSDKWYKIRKTSPAMGNTNFQSLIDLIVTTRKNNPNIPLEDYPTTLLVVSDMQFDPTVDEKTNYEVAMNKLSQVFPNEYVENFKIVWWYCTSRVTSDFPSTMEHAGTYMFSGFDGAIISMLLGGNDNDNDNTRQNNEKPTMEDIINKSLSQEIFTLIK